MLAHGPLAETLAALDARSEHVRHVVGPVDATDGWVTLADAIDDPALVAGWYAQVLAGEADGRADVAGAYLSAWLGATLVEPVWEALRTHRRAWPLTPRSMAVHPHELGWFDGYAVVATTVRVLPDDPAAGHPQAQVVPDPVTLHRLAALELVDLLEPLFAAVRACAPYGLAGMWGAVADSVTAHGLNTVDCADRIGTWRDANRFVDELQARQPRLRARSTLQAVPWSGGEAELSVRGTCCLWYKTQPPSAPDGEGWCTSCPNRSPASRAARWAAWLDEEAGLQV